MSIYNIKTKVKKNQTLNFSVVFLISIVY